MSIRIAFIVASLALCAGTARAASLIMSLEILSANYGQDEAQLHRYSYWLLGASLLKNQELDIRFDPAFYGGLSNGVAGPGFQVLLLQPNNPPGVFGDFSITALVDNPPLSAPFRVDAVYFGQGLPGPQPFYINQLDSNGLIVGTITQGSADYQVPEPAPWKLGGFGLAALVVSNALRRVFRRKA